MNATSNNHTKKVRKRTINTLWYHSYVESKIWHRWTYLQSRNRLTDTENGLVVAKVRRGDWDFRVRRCKLLHKEWINNQVLPYSTCNPTQHPFHNEKEQKNTICTPIRIHESLCCMPETTLCKSTMLQFKPWLSDRLDGWSGDRREAQEEGKRVSLWLIHADVRQKSTQHSNDPSINNK